MLKTLENFCIPSTITLIIKDSWPSVNALKKKKGSLRTYEDEFTRPHAEGKNCLVTDHSAEQGPYGQHDYLQQRKTMRFINHKKQ